MLVPVRHFVYQNFIAAFSRPTARLVTGCALKERGLACLFPALSVNCPCSRKRRHGVVRHGQRREALVSEFTFLWDPRTELSARLSSRLFGVIPRRFSEESHSRADGVRRYANRLPGSYFAGSSKASITPASK